MGADGAKGEGGDEICKKIQKIKMGADEPRLGMALMLKKIDGESPEGPTVAHVMPGSGAEKAGLQKGDLILSMDGKPVMSGEPEVKKDGKSCKIGGLDIPKYEDGQQVVVQFKRDGNVQQATVTASILEDDEMVWIGSKDHNIHIPEIHKLKKLHLIDEKPRLGLALKIEKKNDEVVEGPVVADVAPGSGAEAAGLLKGDLILSMDGKSLISDADDDLHMDIPDLEEGQQVLVQYRRGDSVQQATVTASKLEKGFAHMEEIDIEMIDLHGMDIHKMPHGMFISQQGHGGGLELSTIDQDMAGYFGTDKGVLVVKAPEDHPFQLKSGDVILKVGDKEVSCPKSTYKAIHEYEAGETVTLQILRRSQPLTLTGTMPEASFHKSSCGEKEINVFIEEEVEGEHGEEIIRKYKIQTDDAETVVWEEKEE